jgi:predicted oxidoreductase
MKTMPLARREISNSRIIYGCMGLGGGWNKDSITAEHHKVAEQCIDAALESGITMFDHADIYAFGKAESVFGQVLHQRPGLREQIILQSKCGIRFPDQLGGQRFDFSRDYILKAVDGILGRLGIEYLDILLLHRPDVLMEPEEISEAFSKLRNEGKVRHFGVYNMNVGQIKFIQQALEMPLVVNQLELSLSHLHWVEEGIHVNQDAGLQVHFGEGLLEHCQMENIQIQAWSPLSRGLFTNPLTGSEPDYVRETALLIEQIATENQTTKEAVVLAWTMRHPAKIQPVIGTANPVRIRACADAIAQAERMTREQWYQLFVASRGVPLP